MCFKKKTLPHPEETQDLNATLENIDIKKVVEKWLYDWGVPIVYYPFWQEIDIKLSLEYPYPAATFSETKQMFIRPEWANPGVIAHECSHISYSLLTEAEKTAFESSYTTLLQTDALLRVLHSQNTYMDTNIVEAYAEIARYLGQDMPESLKRFYIKLF